MDNNKSITIKYNCHQKQFIYSCDDYNFLNIDFELAFYDDLEANMIISSFDAKKIKDKFNYLCEADEMESVFLKCKIQNSSNLEYLLIVMVASEPRENIIITITKIENVSTNSSIIDNLTKLLNYNSFCQAVLRIIRQNQMLVNDGEYVLVFFDVMKFKAINEIFGTNQGDNLLIYIAKTLKQQLSNEDIICRYNSDKFLAWINISDKKIDILIQNIIDSIAKYELPFETIIKAGIYQTNNCNVSVDTMIDRAILALNEIKDNYNKKYNYYRESLRKNMLSEQEIVGMMATSLASRQFIVYYQPQYNHTTGMLLGAEALVRWNHPEKGLISPGVFIPIFEKNGFITRLDLYVFEEVCKFLRYSIDNKLALVPISTNFSRHDIFSPGFVENLEKIRNKFNIPVKYLRIEITESAIVENAEHANEIIRELHKCGYVIEMDDFGSGYSSLNVLKDIEFDIIKLDMLFLADSLNSKRTGTIVSSIIRMAKWLGMPIIAEGVETVVQADFLRSIGCDYIQGYLYSKPLPEADYIKLISKSAVGAAVPQLKLIGTLDAIDFWSPKSQETLIFNNYVGGAAIFSYTNGKVEILRVNKKYLQETCMNQTEKDLIESNPLEVFDEDNKAIYLSTIEKAINSMDEEECETWRVLSSECCGDERICVRSNIRVIGSSGDNYLVYEMIRNVTLEKENYSLMLDTERRFKMASEQVNIYFWEYTVATKEMRPCFRCMRDLGLPALLTNYPDSAIEMGVFPPEVADMYRDWHKQIESGVKSLEAIIPLTTGRIPFHVRYTTEFDENGNPIKAYGSAALVVKNS